MKFRMPNLPGMNISLDRGDPQNPQILGSGQLPGGHYRTVTIRGSGIIGGDLHVERATLSGSVRIDGEVTADVLEASGTLAVQGATTAGTADFAGSAHIRGVLRGGTLKFSGFLDVEGDIDAASLRGSGAIQAGAVQADAIALHLSGASAVRELHAKTIEVRPGGSDTAASVTASSRVHSQVSVNGLSLDSASVSSIVQTSHTSTVGGYGPCRLTADAIMGEDIDLEATDAHRVEGGRIHIGPGCTIDQVRYRESLEVDAQSRVKKTIKDR